MASERAHTNERTDVQPNLTSPPPLGGPSCSETKAPRAAQLKVHRRSMGRVNNHTECSIRSSSPWARGHCLGKGTISPEKTLPEGAMDRGSRQAVKSGTNGMPQFPPQSQHQSPTQPPTHKGLHSPMLKVECEERVKHGPCGGDGRSARFQTINNQQSTLREEREKRQRLGVVEVVAVHQPRCCRGPACAPREDDVMLRPRAVPAIPVRPRPRAR